MEEQKTNQQQINIEIPGDVAHGVYCNLAVISHSPTEFVLDFVQMVPGAPKAEVRSRVIMPPQHVKRLLMALEDNLAKYERAFGEVPLPESQVKLPPNFGGPTGFA